MIVIRLMGGLGNQMFQYAAGRRLAALHQTRLVLDLGWFSEDPVSDTPRSYGLGCFQIDADIADAGLLQKLGNAGFSLPGRIITRWRSKGKFHKEKFYGYGYDDRFEHIRDHAYLKGYFQSLRYFEAIAPALRQELHFRDEAAYRALPWYEPIRQNLSVSLHVRRGDYVGQAAHAICSRDYYLKAVEHMQGLLKLPFTVFVFSDDLEWAQRELDIPNAVFVDNSSSELPGADLFLMSSCRHQIIANSTYSWWAAWLNDAPDKQVIAPGLWAPGLRTKDIGLTTPAMHTLS